MTRRRRRFRVPARALLVLALPAYLAGCMAVSPYERPATALPAAWREAPPPAEDGGVTAVAVGAAQPDGEVVYPPADWWRVFGDPELEGLVSGAQRSNHDLKAAASRVRQVEARVRTAAADLYPSLTASTSGGRDGRAGLALEPSYQGGLDASYEIDFWARNRAAVDSAEAALEASRFARETVALSLTAEVATTYFLHVSLGDRLDSAHRQLDNARRILDLVRTQAEWGAVSELQVAQQRNAVASLEATLPTLERQRAEARNALAVLLGVAPEELELPAGRSLASVEVPAVAPGLPAELLTRRPDLRGAEAELVAANADLHAARAALFPSICLTGRGGFASAALSSLFDVGGSFYSLLSGLTAPIFDGDRLGAQRDLAAARYDELVHRYRTAVVAAFRDVEDALAAAKYLSETEAAQRRALREARTAHELAEVQYRAGAIDFMTVLDAQRTLIQAEDTLLQTRLARLNAAVALFKALGGGWSGGAATREAVTAPAPLDV